MIQSRSPSVARFDARADAYLSSAVHADGPELGALRERLREQPGTDVLDLGCGAGHVSFQIAADAREVIAYDPSPRMLNVVGREAHARGLNNIRPVQGVAEALPFADDRFDFVFSRFSAHHWTDLNLASREARRVLKPTGIACFIDVVAPEQPVLDTVLQTMEILRDPGHVRDYSVAQWCRQLGEAGFVLATQERRRLQLVFADWVERIQTPPSLGEAIRILQANSAPAVQRYFAFQPDGSFSCDVQTFWATVA